MAPSFHAEMGKIVETSMCKRELEYLSGSFGSDSNSEEALALCTDEGKEGSKRQGGKFKRNSSHERARAKGSVCSDSEISANELKPKRGRPRVLKPKQAKRSNSQERARAKGSVCSDSEVPVKELKPKRGRPKVSKPSQAKPRRSLTAK